MNRIASITSASVTSAISSTSLRMISNVMTPSEVVRMPSAMVSGTGMVTRLPVRSDCQASLAGSVSTPTTRTPGRIALAAVAQPEISPPPPTGVMQHVEVGHILEKLQRRRALPGDDVRMVERRDDGQAALVGQLPRNRFAVARQPVVEHDLCAIAARRVDLDLRRVRRHDDGRGDAQHLGRQRQPLRVIARRKRHDAALALLRRQLRERVVRAAKLERARALQVFALEEYTGIRRSGRTCAR